MSTYTLQPETISSDCEKNNATTTDGSSANLQSERSTTTQFNFFLQFDISASGIVSSGISTAILDLYYQGVVIADPVGVQVDVYKMTQPTWVETQLSWNNYKTSTAWTTAGGDFVTSSPSGANTTFPSAAGHMTWDITNIVKDAIDTNSSVVNVIVMQDSQSSTRKYALFYSKREATQTSLRPKLTITYTNPVASAVRMLMGVGK